MQHDLWIEVQGLNGKTTVRWHLCISNNEVILTVDAATKAMEWALPHSKHKGQYELKLILLLPDDFEAFKAFVATLPAGVKALAGSNKPGKPANKPLTFRERQTLHLKKQRLSDEEVAKKMRFTKGAVKKLLHRKRVKYKVKTTAELIDKLEALNLL